MRWRDRRRSTNIEDRRGQTPRRGRRVALGGGAVLIVTVLGLIFGVDTSRIASMFGDTSSGGGGQTTTTNQGDDELAEFISVVLADTEDTWNEIFAGVGRSYEAPTLVLFSDAVNSACGFNSAAVGPFYCPADNQVYLDLSFFNDLHRRFGAPGDFAQAYVVAHEVGHHVQNQLGISQQVHRQRANASQAEANELSVRQELQADCFSGVWAYHADQQRALLESGDVEEGLNAAAAVGDDRIQQRAQGRITPESWTHGSAEQRVRWFRRGFESGDINVCDTFSASQL